MKTKSMLDITSKITLIIDDLKNNYNSWDDARDSARKKLIRQLQNINRDLMNPLRIDFNNIPIKEKVITKKSGGKIK